MIFALNLDPIPRILDWNDRFSMHHSIAAALDLDEVGLLTFHHVRARPMDLSTRMLNQFLLIGFIVYHMGRRSS